LSEERVERRLTAILAADVVGYSRLMGADEESTLAALKAIRRELVDPWIVENRGRIVKTTGRATVGERTAPVCSRGSGLYDSPLEGDGFEPSVPRQVFLAAPSIPAQFTFRNINRLARDRDRWFESISLQRRVRSDTSEMATEKWAC
jgi:class 3 adenylate cyclase